MEIVTMYDTLEIVFKHLKSPRNNFTNYTIGVGN